jgi:hypothetical protein
MNTGGFFAHLTIPDSFGGIYEKEELRLPQTETLAPEEKASTSNKMKMRSEKVSGQNV